MWQKNLNIVFKHHFIKSAQCFYTDFLMFVSVYVVGKKARKQDATQHDEEEDMDEGIDINDGPISVRVHQSTPEFYQKKFREVNSS